MSKRSKRNPARHASDAFLNFTASVDFDSRLWRCDIAGSIAHAHALGGAGVLTPKELRLMTAGLRAIAAELEDDNVVLDPRLEDIHMNVESMLTERIGDTGAKLHTGRSRNDQVALDLRLFVREALAGLVSDTAALQRTLIEKAKKHPEAVMPGFTHMQHAQPVLLAHHLLAHFWRLQRDTARLIDCYGRTNISPLGSGALAGTSFRIDRGLVAEMLGMGGITENSMDGVSDRDFAAEAAFALALLQIHLSSLCEELVLWSSQEFGFMRLPEGLASGSSMMPQKLNPDLPELVRGKSGRVVGDLVAILTLLKSLPLAYNRDLQEDKESLFDAVDTAGASLRALTDFLAEVEFDEVRMRKSAGTGLMTATDLADLLTTRGVPFRSAHATVRRIAKEADGDGSRFMELATEQVQGDQKTRPVPLREYLSIEEAVERRNTDGGTSSSSVMRQMEQAKSALSATNDALRRMRKDQSKIERLLALSA